MYLSFRLRKEIFFRLRFFLQLRIGVDENIIIMFFQYLELLLVVSCCVEALRANALTSKHSYLLLLCSHLRGRVV